MVIKSVLCGKIQAPLMVLDLLHDQEIYHDKHSALDFKIKRERQYQNETNDIVGKLLTKIDKTAC